MKQRLPLLGLVALVLTATVAGGLFVARSAGSAGHFAEFAVDNLSCGACVAKIQDALADVHGVGTVAVDLTRGQARVAYNPERVEPDRIAAAISAVGYPARLQRTLTAAEAEAGRADSARLAVDHVGRVGTRLISRGEFEAQVATMRPQGLPAEQEPALRQAVWAKLVENELLLGAAAANGVVVQDGEVAAEIDGMRQAKADFDTLVAKRFGSAEAFARRVKTSMIIDRNIEQHVLNGVAAAEQQQRLREWYAALVRQTPVEVFAVELQPAAGGCGGSGGSCCSKPPANS